MLPTPTNAGEEIGEILSLVTRYFDALHHSDAELLRTVFHPEAIYASATEGTLNRLDMATYLPIVAARESPASRGERRSDQIASIEFAGPVTALARLHCSIGPKQFTDLLSLVKLDGRWQVIAKVFDFELVPVTDTTIVRSTAGV